MAISRKVLIISRLDGFANAVRPVQIKSFLEKNGYQVKLLNTFQQEKTSRPKSVVTTCLMGLFPKELRNSRFIAGLKRRADRIEPLVRAENPDVLICESERDSYIMTKDFPFLKILDSPSPWVDEMFYGGILTRSAYAKLRSVEIEIYSKSDHVAFHWQNYLHYVQQHTYNGNNLFVLNWGCSPKERRAKYRNPPRIAFLGLLQGYWINLPLLSRLSREYSIDVYGGPPPPRKYGLNYKGYAPSTDVLSDYQFGLITISDDPLRRQSFSSKHLEYMNYGLPTLTPEWRFDPQLRHVSIQYNEDNFLEKIHEFSNEDRWQQMSECCYNQAKEWEWSRTLEPLLAILRG